MFPLDERIKKYVTPLLPHKKKSYNMLLGLYLKPKERRRELAIATYLSDKMQGEESGQSWMLEGFAYM